MVLDDNREIFLPPDEMQRVLPGDRVSIVIKPAAAKDKSGKDQSTAELEKLLSTSVNNFVGEVVQKGKAFFVAPDVPELMHFTRWLFIPPNALWREGWRPRSVPTSTAPVCRWQAIGQSVAVVWTHRNAWSGKRLLRGARRYTKMLPKEQFKAIEALVDGGATVDDTREDLRVLPLSVSTLQTRSTSTMRSARSRRTTAGY